MSGIQLTDRKAGRPRPDDQPAPVCVQEGRFVGSRLAVVQRHAADCKDCGPVWNGFNELIFIGRVASITNTETPSRSDADLYRDAATRRGRLAVLGATGGRDGRRITPMPLSASSTLASGYTLIAS